MPKNNRDYDDIFNTIKHNHTRLFISVINDAFKKNYPLDTIPTILPSDIYIENPDYDTIEEKESDLLFNICGDMYLIECQSYEDGSMAIRIAEYAFLSARNNAIWENGRVILTLPAYTVIYVKSNKNTPQKTQITFIMPEGTRINYDCNNIILEDYTKEQLIKNKLFPYIPYYITRYEKEILNNGNIEPALEDLKYFRNELINSCKNNELSPEELWDIMNYINRIIKHITDGNKYEERLVSIMGGKVEETPSHALKRELSEQIALKLFSNNVDYETIRNSIAADMISDEKLTELMNSVPEMA